MSLSNGPFLRPFGYYQNYPSLWYPPVRRHDRGSTQHFRPYHPLALDFKHRSFWPYQKMALKLEHRSLSWEEFQKVLSRNYLNNQNLWNHPFRRHDRQGLYISDLIIEWPSNLNIGLYVESSFKWFFPEPDLLGCPIQKLAI